MQDVCWSIINEGVCTNACAQLAHHLIVCIYFVPETISTDCQIVNYMLLMHWRISGLGFRVTTLVICAYAYVLSEVHVISRTSDIHCHSELSDTCVLMEPEIQCSPISIATRKKMSLEFNCHPKSSDSRFHVRLVITDIQLQLNSIKISGTHSAISLKSHVHSTQQDMGCCENIVQTFTQWSDAINEKQIGVVPQIANLEMDCRQFGH